MYSWLIDGMKLALEFFFFFLGGGGSRPRRARSKKSRLGAREVQGILPRQMPLWACGLELFGVLLEFLIYFLFIYSLTLACARHFSVPQNRDGTQN